MTVENHRRLVVFTDLDGCLLDHQTYSWAPAGEALGRLREDSVPVALCSSKSRAEMEAIAAELGLNGPLVAENGGVIVIPDGHLPFDPPGAHRDEGRLVVATGVSRDRLVRSLADIAAEAGVRVTGFAGLSTIEIARLTDLDSDAAARAARRQCDEPFLILDDSPRARAALRRAAASRGLRVSAGGRFLHLTGDTDKGRAVAALLGWYRQAGRPVWSVGLGDAPVDLPMLQVVDRPIIIPRPDGEIHGDLARGLPGAERASHPGPSGWNEAMLAVLGGRRLAVVSAAGAPSGRS